MSTHTPPEFFKAFDHDKAMVKQYGEGHPITEQAFMLKLHYTSEHIKAEMDAKAKELNLLSFEDAEQHLLEMMDNRQKVGLSNDGILINSNIHINRVQ